MMNWNEKIFEKRLEARQPWPTAWPGLRCLRLWWWCLCPCLWRAPALPLTASRLDLVAPLPAFHPTAQGSVLEQVCSDLMPFRCNMLHSVSPGGQDYCWWWYCWYWHLHFAILGSHRLQRSFSPHTLQKHKKYIILTTTNKNNHILTTWN